MIRSTRILSFAAVGLATLAMTGVADARQGHVRASSPQGAVAAGAGPNGGAYARGRATVQNSDGSVTNTTGGAVRTANGGTGYRASQTTVNPDGSVTRQGGFNAQGQNGSASSSGSFSRSADGTLSGSRTTTATNANTGVSYSGSTTIDPATGKPVHTGTCTDASGATISCPR